MKEEGRVLSNTTSKRLLLSLPLSGVLQAVNAPDMKGLKDNHHAVNN